jgi:hypothetical protein
MASVKALNSISNSSRQKFEDTQSIKIATNTAKES